jgi:hypothetical protein
MCLSGDPFVPKKGAVGAEESCGFELEKRPLDPAPIAYNENYFLPKLTNMSNQAPDARDYMATRMMVILQRDQRR